MKEIALILSLACLPAHATMVGLFEFDNGRVDLFDDPGVCVGKALRAEFVPSEGPAVAGCWTLDRSGESIRVVLLDARANDFLVGDIRPAKAV